MAIGVALIGGGIWAKEEHLVSQPFNVSYSTTLKVAMTDMGIWSYSLLY